jgi:hypothetical protein
MDRVKENELLGFIFVCLTALRRATLRSQAVRRPSAPTGEEKTE